jgi:hypothetical protein
VGLRQLRHELGRFRDETRARADRFRLSVDEKLRASAGRGEQLEARMESQQALLEKLQRSVANVGSRLRDYLPRAFADDAIHTMVTEALADAIGPALEGLRATQAAWDEALDTLRTDSSALTREVGRDRGELRRDLDERHEDIDNRFAAQQRALDLVGATVSSLLAEAGPEKPAAPPDDAGGEKANSGLHWDWPGEGKRTEVSALLGNRWRRTSPAAGGKQPATPAQGADRSDD